MPYGIKDESPNQTKWMEKCVMKIMKSGKDKSSAIAICKSQLEKSKDTAKAELVLSFILGKED
jgi:hypothetical protein